MERTTEAAREPVVERYADLARRILDRPPRLGRTRLVAVDGPSGAGKTVFANRLAAAVSDLLGPSGGARPHGSPREPGGPPGHGGSPWHGDVPGHGDHGGSPVCVVHTDDLLDGWADQFTFWSRLQEWVLAPLRAGRPGRYRRYDWHRGRFGTEEVPVPAVPVLILEGVSTARAGIAAELTCAVFVTAPDGLRRRRAIDRDGPGVLPHLDVWRRAERVHFAADDTAARADLIVDGAPRVAHHPDVEYVRLAKRPDDVPPPTGGWLLPPTAASGAVRNREPTAVPKRETGRAERTAGTGTPGKPTIAVMTTPTITESQLRAAIERELPGVRADLERLIRIPGIAFDGFDHSHVERSAEAVAELLRGCSLEVRVVRAGKGQPAVIGRRPGPPGAPTVLLYAHHDVQPVGDLAQWRSDPFEPVERDGRLYGRGAADDKAGIMAHVAALRAFGDALPVGVALFIEGEEEYGSESLEELLVTYRDELAADVIVIADSANWEIGVPALTTSLRGIVNCFVEVRTLAKPVHSGMFGGAVPDALTVLCRLIATLHDEAGDVAVPGLVGRTGATVDYPPERLRAEAGMVDGLSFIGTGRLTDRIWTKPAISVLGIDAPATGTAPNALVPAAKAKLSLRLAPGDDPKRAYAALRDHLQRHAPWGASVTVTLEHDGAPCVIDASGPMFDAARAAFRAAWDGTEPVEIGIGGSIPFIATFQELFPQAAILVTGVEDPEAGAHGPNESLHLGEFARVCLAEALLLANVAEAARSRS